MAEFVSRRTHCVVSVAPEIGVYQLSCILLGGKNGLHYQRDFFLHSADSSIIITIHLFVYGRLSDARVVVIAFPRTHAHTHTDTQTTFWSFTST